MNFYKVTIKIDKTYEFTYNVLAKNLMQAISIALNFAKTKDWVGANELEPIKCVLEATFEDELVSNFN